MKVVGIGIMVIGLLAGIILGFMAHSVKQTPIDAHERKLAEFAVAKQDAQAKYDGMVEKQRQEIIELRRKAKERTAALESEAQEKKEWVARKAETETAIEQVAEARSAAEEKIAQLRGNISDLVNEGKGYQNETLAAEKEIEVWKERMQYVKPLQQ